MKYFPLIFTVLILQVIMFTHLSCNKETADDVLSVTPEEVLSSDKSVTPEEWTLIQGRDGVTIENGLYFEETWSWDNFFVDSIRNHKLFNGHKIDSIYKKRINTGSARLRNSITGANVDIADYEITFLYKNDDIETITTIAEIEKDGWYKKSAINSLLSSINPNSTVFYQKEKNIIRAYNPSTGRTINMNTWKISIKPNIETDVVTIIEKEKLYPVKTGSNQWGPLHIF